MEKNQTSEVIVRVPPSVAADIGNDEIIDLLLVWEKIKVSILIHTRQQPNGLMAMI